MTAFEKLYDKYAPALYTVVLQILRDEAASDDVFKKVFMIIWNKVDEFDPEKGNLFTWMFQIARITAIQELQSSDRQNFIESTIPSQKIEILGPDANLDRYGLKKIIEHLEEDQKVILNLHYYKGHTTEQIAEMLNLSENIVRTTIKIALSELRTLLFNK